MWIIMTASARCPSSWTWNHERRRVACVKLDQEYTAHDWTPKMISPRARGVLDVRIISERAYVGSSGRCQYAQAVAEAKRRCHEMNNAPTIIDPAELYTWGGSA